MCVLLLIMFVDQKGACVGVSVHAVPGCVLECVCVCVFTRMKKRQPSVLFTVFLLNFYIDTLVIKLQEIAPI